jgi:archaellum component FlaC
MRREEINDYYKNRMKQLSEGTSEMEANVERLRKEIQELLMEKEALMNGNSSLYERRCKALLDF